MSSAPRMDVGEEMKLKKIKIILEVTPRWHAQLCKTSKAEGCSVEALVYCAMANYSGTRRELTKVQEDGV